MKRIVICNRSGDNIDSLAKFYYLASFEMTMKTTRLFRSAFLALLALIVTATTSRISLADDAKAADSAEKKNSSYDENLSASKTDKKCYELRIYTVADGKMDLVSNIFKDKVIKLFEKNGLKNVGYWTPLDGKGNQFVYMLMAENREAHKKAWAAFRADEEWKKNVSKEFKVDGKNVVTDHQSILLHATDYSPAIEVKDAGKPRVFELRTYTTEGGRLENLHDRFRVHTKSLFERHGMTNIGYWGLDAEQDKKHCESDPANTLIYFLAHDSADAKAASFKAFVSDPVWKPIVQDSEKRAGGSLTVKGGVKSTMLKATDYSPLK